MRNLISNILSHSPHVPLKYARNPTVVFLSLPLTPWGVGSKGTALVGPRELLLVTFLVSEVWPSSEAGGGPAALLS